MSFALRRYQSLLVDETVDHMLEGGAPVVPTGVLPYNLRGAACQPTP
jgi:hypothetical protein